MMNDNVIRKIITDLYWKNKDQSPFPFDKLYHDYPIFKDFYRDWNHNIDAPFTQDVAVLISNILKDVKR